MMGAKAPPLVLLQCARTKTNRVVTRRGNAMDDGVKVNVYDGETIGGAS